MGILIPLAITAAAGAGTAAAAGGTVSSLALAASLAGTGISAIGAIQQGNAASQAAAYNAQVAANNAKIATRNAGFASQEGEANAAAKGMQNRKAIGEIKAGQAANGIDVNKGSAVDVRSSAAELGELDAINIRSNAARQAYGFQTQAAGDVAQSQLDRSESKNDAIGGYVRGGGTLLSGFGNTWMNYSKSSSPFSTDDLTDGGTNYQNSFDPVGG